METTQKQSEPANKFTFQINPPTSKNRTPPNMIALKKIENYSYALSDEIGLGLTSHVYKGRCEVTNQQVAVKVIDTKIKNKDDEFQSKFIKDQIEVLEKIKQANTANLLKLQCVIQSKNNLYIITQFCEGNDVAKILRKKIRFDERQAQSIMKQLLKGYRQLYNLRIIHRDLKLANIFITKGLVKIADFGFATSEQLCKKKFDYNVGSPFYMSPEALKNNEYSFLSDVWGIGVIAYQLVYGRVPWKDKNDQVLWSMIMNCPIEKLFDSDRQVSDRYLNFIKMCLTIDRSRRAQPEEIINFQWPMASEYVQGLEPVQKRRSAHGMVGQRGPSLDKIIDFGNKKQQGKPNQRVGRESMLEKQNGRGIKNHHHHHHSLPKIVVQNVNNENKKPPQDQNSIQNKPMNRAEQQQPPYQVPQSQTSQPKHSHKNYFQSKINLPFSQSQLYSPENNKNELIKKKEENCSQMAILSQIHYCRFIYQLYMLIKGKNQMNSTWNMVRMELASRLAFKMSILMNLVHKQQNQLQSPDFGSFIKTEEWKKLKDIIFQYNLRYRDEMKNQQIRVINFFKEQANAGDDIIAHFIKQMKHSLPNNHRILQFVTYYYQMREEEERSPAHLLSEKTKIEYLVEECSNFRETQSNENIRFGDEEEKMNLERLFKKLALMGF